MKGEPPAEAPAAIPKALVKPPAPAPRPKAAAVSEVQPKSLPAVKRTESMVEHDKVSKAVQESLNRAVTADLATPPPRAHRSSDPGTGSLADAVQESACERESDIEDEDPQCDPEAAEMARLKRENHARFMRFSRSLKSTVAAFWDACIAVFKTCSGVRLRDRMMS